MDTKPIKFPSAHEPGRTDWIEYIVNDGKPGTVPALYRINLSWLLSNWKCTYGDKCPSILNSGVNVDHGCCQIGVHFGLYEGPDEKRDEWQRVKENVKELTPEDWDYGYGIDKPDDFWTVYEAHTVSRKGKHKTSNAKPTRVMVPEQTKVVDGACIFANRTGGAAGKIGCAFHHLAERKGVHHSETKPDICWMMPFSVGDRYDDDLEMDVYTVTSINGPGWGPYDTSLMDGLGHWCTEIPDHFIGTDPVYKYAETDLRKIMGDDRYERMVEEIEKVGPRRFPMPGELFNGGRKMLPLLVENRKKQWEEIGETDKAKQAEVWLGQQQS